MMHSNDYILTFKKIFQEQHIVDMIEFYIIWLG